MRRSLDFSTDEYYHIYSRGVDKRTIFIENADKDRFVRLLYVCNTQEPIIYRLVQGKGLDEIKVKKKLVSIGAYCLMGNHFHILLKGLEVGGITKYMSKLMTAYSMYFNKKHERRGALFESEFKAKHLDTDEYLKYIFSYIHLNPVKFFQPDWKERGITDVRQAQNFLSNYPYSSYLDYIGKSREEDLILDKSAFPEYFANYTSFKNYLDEWLSFGLKD